MAKKTTAKISGPPEKRACFQCDGTGQMCNICGESESACECDEEDFFTCPNCKGSGVAVLDQEQSERT